jgi:hypothetical protein
MFCLSIISRGRASVQNRNGIFGDFANRNFLESGDFSKFSLATMGQWWYDNAK